MKFDRFVRVEDILMEGYTEEELLHALVAVIPAAYIEDYLGEAEDRLTNSAHSDEEEDWEEEEDEEDEEDSF